MLTGDPDKTTRARIRQACFRRAGSADTGHDVVTEAGAEVDGPLGPDPCLIRFLDWTSGWKNTTSCT